MAESGPPWKAWYKTARWQALRWSCLIRDGFTCRKCGRLEGNSSKLVADHIKPHRGNPDLFWDPDNIQTLCAEPCHSSIKQAEEQDSLNMRGVWY